MNLDRNLAEQRLAEVACGDLAEASPQWREVVRTFPEFAAQLAELREVQRDLDWSTDDAGSLAEAAAEPTVRDRALLRAALPASAARRWWQWPLLVAAMLAIGLIVLPMLRSETADNGMLGNSGGIRVEQRGERIVLHDLPQAEPGELYVLTLEADGTTLTASFPSSPIELPEAWQATSARAQKASIKVAIRAGSWRVALR
ncbi:MAG: hypothetical protein JNK15_14755 [Planctomycetes bacterium]|nr:hypothetical protein [Planctomycetota bacterium]